MATSTKDDIIEIKCSTGLAISKIACSYSSIYDEIKNKINRREKLLQKRINNHIWKFGNRR